MFRLLMATIAVAIFVLPAYADGPVSHFPASDDAPIGDAPAGLACVALPSWLTALEHTGQTVLGLVPAPYTAQPVLYWRTPGGLVVMAPVGPAADGSGPCVAYEHAVPLGMYRVGQTS